MKTLIEMLKIIISIYPVNIFKYLIIIRDMFKGAVYSYFSIQTFFFFHSKLLIMILLLLMLVFNVFKFWDGNVDYREANLIDFLLPSVYIC